MHLEISLKIISSSISLPWESDFSAAFYGKYYYINHSFSISTDYRNTIKYLFIESFYIKIHKIFIPSK